LKLFQAGRTLKIRNSKFRILQWWHLEISSCLCCFLLKNNISRSAFHSWPHYPGHFLAPRVNKCQSDTQPLTKQCPGIFWNSKCPWARLPPPSWVRPQLALLRETKWICPISSVGLALLPVSFLAHLDSSNSWTGRRLYNQSSLSSFLQGIPRQTSSPGIRQKSPRTWLL
jgi:hypothetical protein